jgi:hypothetical protein
MSLYHWGLAHPWGENELPRPGTFAAMLRGEGLGAHAPGGVVPDFYATYAEGRDKPLAIVETGILYDPAATDGTQSAAGILYAGVDATSADKACVVFVRDAEVNANELIWPDSIAAGAKAVATQQLNARGIFLR